MLAKPGQFRVANLMGAFSLTLFCCSLSVLSSASAWAQASPTPTAHPLVHVPIPLPINPPKGWNASQWASFRARCQRYYDKGLSKIPLTLGEIRTLETCATYGPYPASVTREPPSAQSTSLPPNGIADAGA